MPRTAVKAAVVFSLFVVGAVGAWAAGAHYWPLALSGSAGAALPGLHVDGEVVPGGADLQALVRRRADVLLERHVRLVVVEPDGRRPLLDAGLGELGVQVDVDAVVSRALRQGREGDPLTRARLAERARRGELDIPLSPTVDTRALVARLADAKQELDTAPTPARLDLDAHAVLPEADGRALDLDAVAERLGLAALDPAAVEVELPFVPVRSTVTRASLARVDISKVVASFKTYFSRFGDQGPRARNIEVAASHVNGLVIEPGQTISFNDIVGERSEANGFKTAFEIVKGEYKEGVGGGTCQVASTLHAIAFFGGLDILQRLPHSRPSAYIPSGLDATVVYPVVDLKLRNPFTFPVVVHATVGANVITMELLGADKPVEVSFGKEILSTTPFERRVDEDPGVSKPKRKQKGIQGMELFRSRVLTYRDGTRRVENSRDVYPPTREIWLVPPGYDQATLPALGEDLPKPDDPRPQASR